MMELLSDIFIKCSVCGCSIGIHKEDIDFNTFAYDHGENEIEFRISSRCIQL